MDLHKTLYPFYTTKKIPHERTRSVRICLESYSGGAVFKFAKGLYLSSFTAFAELHEVSTDIIIIVNCRQLSLNWTWTIHNCVAVLTLVYVHVTSLLKI